MNEPGELIIIEGLDGSGKSTQTALLAEYLRDRGTAIRQLKFPNYENKSSTLVRMYLGGEIGGVGNVNLYAASSFYACDRYITFATDWSRDYESGITLLCDRYATSNLVYQMAKLPREEWDAYAEWLLDYEFRKLELPEPSLVIYLDMHPDTSRGLLEKRCRENGDTLDIHEQNLRYLLDCRESALYAAGKLGWHVLRCCDGRTPLPVEETARLIQSLV